MRSHTHPAVDDFHRLPGQVHVHLLVHQRIRHAVVVPLHLDVIVDVDAGRLPFAELVAHSRQWLQRRPIQLREQRGAAALAFAEWPLVEPHQQLGNGLVDFREGEELALAQGRDDPALDYLNADLRLGLVPGPIRPRRNDCHAVVFAQVAVGGVQIRLVIAGMGDSGLQVIWDHDLGHATEELPGPHMRTDPVP